MASVISEMSVDDFKQMLDKRRDALVNFHKEDHRGNHTNGLARRHHNFGSSIKRNYVRKRYSKRIIF